MYKPQNINELLFHHVSSEKSSDLEWWVAISPDTRTNKNMRLLPTIKATFSETSLITQTTPRG